MRSFLFVGALVATSCAARGPGGPLIETVEPSLGLEGLSTAITIVGRFEPTPHVSFKDLSASRVDLSFAAELGGVELLDITWVEVSTLTAVAPATLGRGRHDLVIIDAAGRLASSTGAFRVVAALEDGGGAADAAPPADGNHNDGGPGDALSSADGSSSDGGSGDGLEGDGVGGDQGDPFASGDPTACTTCSCADDTCSFVCPGGCSLECSGTAVCDLDCSGPSACKGSCTDDATCGFVCDTGCGFVCSGRSTCDVQCLSGGCELSGCQDQASCLLVCGVPGTCTVSCTGTVTNCGAGVWACRRPCP